jgi:hypothetical protein
MSCCAQGKNVSEITVENSKGKLLISIVAAASTDTPYTGPVLCFTALKGH